MDLHPDNELIVADAHNALTETRALIQKTTLELTITTALIVKTKENIRETREAIRKSTVLLNSPLEHGSRRLAVRHS